jgi:dTDP-4-amino-4,6-dideoxygalactose transaminase
LIPFLDLKAQYYSIKPDIDAAILRVLESSQFVLGQEVEAFEREFAEYCHAKHAIGVNSGTSALHLALLAAGVGPGDEVITVPFTFVATAAAIVYAGARPVFVDIDPRSFNIDVNQIESAITPRTKAILPVHLYGQPADMDPIMDIARRRGLVVIEDACQAHGAEYKGRRVGAIGEIGCFSFYPGKNLGAYGEGGAVTTSNGAYAQTVRMLRDWGQDRKYHHVSKGYNYRMDGIQGAVLRAKLRYLEVWTEARREQASRYNQVLSVPGVRTPWVPVDHRHVYHIYAIRVSQRDIIQNELHERGIQTGIHYPVPVHLQPAYADIGCASRTFPEAEAAAQEVISLPIFPELTPEQQSSVSTAVLTTSRAT